MDESTVHPGKWDTWVLALVAGAPLLIAVLGVVEIVGGDHAKGLAMLGGIAGLALLSRVLLFPMAYELAAAELVVRLGLLRVRYPYESILSGGPSSDPFGGYAMSTDRVRLDIRKKGGGTTYILVAPRDKQRFLSDLVERSGRHAIVGEKLVRTDAGA